MCVDLRDLLEAWHLPGRALLLGMPLTMLLNALPAHYLVQLGWTEAFLVGNVLSPTDPVFAAAIVGREEVPHLKGGQWQRASGHKIAGGCF